MDLVEKSSLREDPPEFEIGDTVDVHLKILEGNKERIQVFAGIVIARRGHGIGQTFTVRRVAYGEGVERVFPVHSPNIEKIVVDRESIVTRSRLYYLRDRVGKAATKVKEKRNVESRRSTKATPKIKS